MFFELIQWGMNAKTLRWVNHSLQSQLSDWNRTIRSLSLSKRLTACLAAICKRAASLIALSE
jgi:hypothetical protein